MKRAYLYILGSFAWLIGGGIALSVFLDPKDESSLPVVLIVALVVGFVILFLIGTALWAKAKGYHPVIGVILGWVGPLGLLVLTILPDKSPPLEGRSGS